MRFLADENFPGSAVAALQAAGHEVVWIRTTAPGITDLDVLAWASQEGRILLTFDKDFGELARGSTLPSTCGVILLRMPMARDVGQRAASVITARDDWAGYFSVIEPGRVRMRPLRAGEKLIAEYEQMPPGCGSLLWDRLGVPGPMMMSTMSTLWPYDGW